MNKDQIENLRLGIARLKDCKANLEEAVRDGEDLEDSIEEQFAEDGAGGEALDILQALLREVEGGNSEPKPDYEWKPQVGDKVPFNECPDGWGDDIEGTVTAFNPELDEVSVSVPKGSAGLEYTLVFERTGSSWSLDGVAKRERGLRGEEPYSG